MEDINFEQLDKEYKEMTEKSEFNRLKRLDAINSIRCPECNSQNNLYLGLGKEIGKDVVDLTEDLYCSKCGKIFPLSNNIKSITIMLNEIPESMVKSENLSLSTPFYGYLINEKIIEIKGIDNAQNAYNQFYDVKKNVELTSIFVKLLELEACTRLNVNIRYNPSGDFFKKNAKIQIVDGSYLGSAIAIFEII